MEGSERALGDPLTWQERGEMALGGPAGGAGGRAALPSLRPQSQGLIPTPCTGFIRELLCPALGAGDSRSSRTETLGVDPPCQSQPLSAEQQSRREGRPTSVSLPGSKPVQTHGLSPPALVPTAVSYCWRVPALGAPRLGSALWAGSALYPAPECLGSHATNRCPVPGANAPVQGCAERRQGCQDILVGSQVGP